MALCPAREKSDVPGREGEPPCEPAGIGEGTDGASPTQNGLIPTTRGIKSPPGVVLVDRAETALKSFDQLYQNGGDSVNFTVVPTLADVAEAARLHG